MTRRVACTWRARPTGRPLDSVLQRHATADRAASGVQRLPVAGISGGVGMRSPQPQDALQLLPAGRVTGIVHRLPVLVQEEPTLARGQPVQDPLQVERVLALGRLGAYGVIVTRRGTAWSAARGRSVRVERKATDRACPRTYRPVRLRCDSASSDQDRRADRLRAPTADMSRSVLVTSRDRRQGRAWR